MMVEALDRRWENENRAAPAVDDDFVASTNVNLAVDGSKAQGTRTSSARGGGGSGGGGGGGGDFTDRASGSTWRTSSTLRCVRR